MIETVILNIRDTSYEILEADCDLEIKNMSIVPLFENSGETITVSIKLRPDRNSNKEGYLIFKQPVNNSGLHIGRLILKKGNILKIEIPDNNTRVDVVIQISKFC